VWQDATLTSKHHHRVGADERRQELQRESEQVVAEYKVRLEEEIRTELSERLSSMMAKVARSSRV
jgi:hypothetical protein